MVTQVVSYLPLVTLLLLPSLGAQVLYNPQTTTCCRSTLFPIELNENVFCCDGATFHFGKELCCDEKVVALPQDVNNSDVPEGLSKLGELSYMPILRYGCCGEEIFNFEKELCCNDKVIKIPEKEPGRHETFFSCCGEEIYNITSQDCCRGKVMPRNRVTEVCCGHQIIDATKSLCCTADFTDPMEVPVVYDRDEPDVDCCGREKYNVQKAICCNGKVVPVSYNPEKRSRTFCCGDKAWVPSESELCCDGKIVPVRSQDNACCGTKLYDVNTHFCCGGTMVPILGNTSSCCGPKIYDYLKESCCYSSSKVLPLGKDENKNLCCE